MSSTTSINKRILAYSSLAMGFSLISSAFGFYYVKVFLNFYHIQEKWFQVSQVLFMIWNAVNDPLFAYLQDSTNFSFTRTRRESILYAAPLFAASFLVPWFPWGSTDGAQAWVTGIHLITALCFWDTMFTYIGLAHCCLFAEISKDNNVRLKLILYSQIGSLLGSSSVFMLQYISDNLENFRAFQYTCIFIAIISCLLMRYTGFHAHTEIDLRNKASKASGDTVPEKSQKYSYFTLTKQILFNRDFLSFVICNFFQEFHKTCLGNFLAIFCDQLIPKAEISTYVRSTYYGSISSLSQIVVIFGTPIVARFGYFRIVRWNFIYKIISSCTFILIGSRNPMVLMAFLLLDSCTTNATFSLFNMPLSDIADADAVRYSREHPVTSMVFGTNALVVKSAISLSPMLVVNILNRYGYEDLKKDKLSPVQVDSLNDAMFYIIALYPLVLGTIQLAVWSLYTIRDKESRQVVSDKVGTVTVD